MCVCSLFPPSLPSGGAGSVRPLPWPGLRREGGRGGERSRGAPAGGVSSSAAEGVSLEAAPALWPPGCAPELPSRRGAGGRFACRPEEKEPPGRCL